MNTETKPSITLQKVESSQIFAIGFDADTNTLAVRFKNKAGEATSLYHYANVTQEDFDAFKSAESIGSHFYKHIKPNPEQFPYQRVEVPQAA